MRSLIERHRPRPARGDQWTAIVTPLPALKLGCIPQLELRPVGKRHTGAELKSRDSKTTSVLSSVFAASPTSSGIVTDLSTSQARR
jgi:hypothetical protein